MTNLLSYLKDCSSQNPMPLPDLAEKSGMSIEDVNVAVDDLYRAGRIGKCTITRSGVTNDVIWPTGAVPKHVFVVAKPKQVSQIEEQQEEETMEGKTKTQTVLEMIAERGSVPLKELETAANTAAVAAFVKSHVDRGLIVISGGRGERVYSLAPGVTGDQLLGKKTAEVPEEIPVQSRAQQSRKRFRLAKTSDDTLMLFGLDDSPLELDQEDTRKLVDFVTSSFRDVSEIS